MVSERGLFRSNQSMVLDSEWTIILERGIGRTLTEIQKRKREGDEETKTEKTVALCNLILEVL